MSLLERGDKAYLLLADGTIFEGLHFGVKGTAIGEVVFTTGMTAYQETLTDPSYYGQLVTQTFPADRKLWCECSRQRVCTVLYSRLHCPGMVQHTVELPYGGRH